jgi:hypothetical protein
MKKMLAVALAMISSIVLSAQSTTVVISQVYGGGGSGTATYRSDYVELHNISSVSQDISGFKILYGATSGNLASTATNAFTFPANTIIPAGGYLLVASAPSTGLAPLPITPDHTFTLGLSGSNGKVAFGTAAMINNATYAAQPAGSVIDFVGYGTANESETSPVAALSGTTAAFRKNNGCLETNNNNTDFSVAAPAPRNASTAPFLCSGGGTVPTLTNSTLTSFGNQPLSTPSTAQSLTISGTNLTGFPGQITISSSSTDFEVSNNNNSWGASTTINYDSATLIATNCFVRFNPQTNGVRNGVITISGGGVSPSVTINVTGIGGTITPPPTSGVVISQVYGAGGNPGAVFNADYVELHNNTSTSQTLVGYSIQYAAAGQTATWTGIANLPTLTIPAGGYYLIQMSSIGTGGGALPTVDHVASPTISMSATNGRVALVSDTNRLSACPSTANVIDLVGYGTSNCFEGGAAVPALDTLNAAFRNNNGCDDTNNNLADFTRAAPAPRNSASPVFLCAGLPDPVLNASALQPFGDVCVGNTSLQITNISGSNLTANSMVVGPLSGYAFSTNILGPFSDSLILNVSIPTQRDTMVYVQFVPLAAVAYSGSIPVRTTNTSIALSVSGNGLAPIQTVFSPIASICAGGSFQLPSSSNNGISGSWFPAINNLQTTTYYFNPTGGVCATRDSLTVVVDQPILPAFDQVSAVCRGTSFSLPSTSTNGISGTWSPNPNFNATTTYTFTPTAGQCASTTTMTVTVNDPGVQSLVASDTTICSGVNVSFPSTSLNNINGNWAPVFNPNATTTYTFTPLDGQCALPATRTITVNPTTTTSFNTIAPICAGANFTLPTTSTNNINGAWAPAINNTTTTTYTFTPVTGVCATQSTLTVVVNPILTPSFDTIPPICSGTSLTLATISNNGVTGTWSPAANNTATTNYVFTPSAGQCATTRSITVVVNPLVIPTFNSIAPICSGSSLSLPTSSINGISGTWTPAVNNTATTSYTFIPNAGQCAVNNSGLTVEVIPVTLPTFTQIGPICVGDTFVLPTTSLNGINGSWLPAVNTIATTTYTFVPINAPCSPNATMTVEVNANNVVMVTADSSNITQNAATLAGQFSGALCATPTNYGIEFSGVSGFTPGFGTRVSANNLDTAGRFSVRLNGLVQNTVYYYVAYSIDGTGSKYGEQKLFTTEKIPQGFTIFGNPVLRGTPTRFSLSGIKPGVYSFRILNIHGQLVYQKSIEASVNFIDGNFTIPQHFPIGLYNVQIVNPFFRIQKNLMVQ